MLLLTVKSASVLLSGNKRHQTETLTSLQNGLNLRLITSLGNLTQVHKITALQNKTVPLGKLIYK